jgi:E3 ubiquitin-protein ligase ATL10/75/76/77/78
VHTVIAFASLIFSPLPRAAAAASEWRGGKKASCCLAIELLWGRMGRPDSEVVQAPSASAEVNGTGDGGAAPGGEASFDASMVIILAALFFALLFAIGLNSLARCGGRGGGAKKHALKSIPVEVYGGGKEQEEEVCAICLGEFADGEKVRVLPRCGHGFHVRCVDAWLLSRGSCPTCRRPVMPVEKGVGGGVSQSRRLDSNTIAVVVT